MAKKTSSEEEMKSKTLPTKVEGLNSALAKETRHTEEMKIENLPTKVEGLEAEVADVPFPDDKDYNEIIRDIQKPEIEKDHIEYVAGEATKPDYGVEPYELEPEYEDEDEQCVRDIDKQLHDEGYFVKTRIERDVDMINRPLQPNPTEDKENDLRSKSGIPKYVDRSEG